MVPFGKRVEYCFGAASEGPTTNAVLPPPLAVDKIKPHGSCHFPSGYGRFLRGDRAARSTVVARKAGDRRQSADAARRGLRRQLRSQKIRRAFRDAECHGRAALSERN